MLPLGPLGAPCVSPPWGWLAAIDLDITSRDIEIVDAIVYEAAS